MSTAPSFNRNEHSRVDNIVNVIQSWMASQWDFVPTKGPINDGAFKDIELLKFVSGYCDTWNLPILPELDTFACVSKAGHEIALEAKRKRLLEHISLKEQVASLKDSGCKTAQEAINFVIKHNLKIADLKDFPDLTEKHLEKLFTHCPNLHHLMIKSELITQIPAMCHELVSLDCSDCDALKSLPDCLAELKMLKCGYCHAFTSLPECLVQLKTFNCNCCHALNRQGITSLETFKLYLTQV